MTSNREQKKRYSEEIAQLKRKIDEVTQHIKYLESRKTENENLNRLLLASDYADLVSVYCAMADLSVCLLGFKNESFLDLGRKSLYKSIITIESVVSNVIDMQLGENYDVLKGLEGYGDGDRLRLVRKLGYAISLLEDKYGKSSKWKWSFVEMGGRYAVVTKNLFDFRSYQEKNDPRVEGFDDRYDYLYLVKELLIDSSNRYREKYEMTDHTPDDMMKAVDSLKALKRIHILFNESDEVQSVTKRIDLWSMKLEDDIRAKEEEMKRRRRDDDDDEDSTAPILAGRRKWR
jgi:hypothetical protein